MTNHLEEQAVGPLTIVVCIKQVPLLSALRFDTEARRLIREGVPLDINELDVYALTEAIKLRDTWGGEVIALTMGPPQAHEALAMAIAMGADRALHLSDRAFSGADTLATARTLALAIQRGLGATFDLIFCGRHSIDAETSQVGPELAEFLAIPQISAVQQLTLQVKNGRRIVVAQRETDSGSETLSAPLPSLLTTIEQLNDGIWPDEQAIQQASGQSERYQILSAADLGIDPAQVGQAGSPTWVESIHEDLEKRAGRLIIDDDPVQAIEQLVMALEEQGLLDPPVTMNLLDLVQPMQPRRQETRSSNHAVWVVAERQAGGLRHITFELLGKGRELAATLQGELAAVLLGGPDSASLATLLAAYGAERVYVATDEALENYSTDGYTTLVVQAITHYQPAVVLFGSTAEGRDLAPRVAARLQLGLTGDCLDLAIDDQQRLVQYKPAFGNRIISAILSKTRPALSTLRPGMLHASKPDFSQIPLLTTLPTRMLSQQIKTSILNQVEIESPERAHLETATTVLGLGMGLGSPEQYQPVYQLAELLNAALGATRNVTHAGWLPKQAQVGLTGRAIAPRLYIALGIRGAAEHLAGIRKAGYVVALNKNKRAPIFRHADLGIVGDVHVLLPLLVQRLEQRQTL